MPKAVDVLEQIAKSDDAVFAFDANDLVILWNKGCERLLGRPAYEVLGRHCYDIMCGRDAFGNFPVGRRVTTIRGSIRSGNSGGPVVDAQGRVITTAFAQRAGSDGGYGVPTDAVRAAIASAGVKALDTPCVDR